MGVALRKITQHAHHGQAEKGQGRELVLARRLLRVQVRAQGLLVISLNMAGSVPDAADLVVTDPVQAGVMAVMAVADTAKFTVERLKRRVF